MAERNGKTHHEVQLDFAFVAGTAPVSSPVAAGAAKSVRLSREARPRGLTTALAAAHTALLDASLNEINAQLLPLLEFCEAALTRALDVIPLRKGALLSPEELRSVHGIGQGQWLLNEAHTKREVKQSAGKGKSRKRTVSTD
ncbi:MAG TPA: hypothetical protein VNN62_17160 [Methylomirabilota bacterium]|nr:hypothetical protein [Methylomirabilota bacterium]